MNAWATSLLGRARAVAAVWKNPVVIRDLRVRMRGTRSYWHLAAYLGLLCLLALAGYATATEFAGRGSGMDPVEAQQRLQIFYYFIFFTLAGLVCLIAPALTAASITTEKQRLTLDLLVTTPMSSAELLTGKLVSSVAFLTLLLAMSLPASALCVILGGATLGDVLRTYLVLALDGLVLSAVGLYMSCTAKNSMQALMATYGAILFGLFITFPLVAGLAFSTAMGMGGAGLGPLTALAALHPFVAVMAPSAKVTFLGASVPTWPFTVLAAFLAIRLLLTGATYRMGSYGTDALGSLRRQLLFITGVGAFLGVYGIAAAASGPAGTAVVVSGMALTHSAPGFGPVTSGVEQFLLYAFYFCALCLPSLFVPGLPEDAAPGQAVAGTYDVKKAFRAVHEGALPYFHLWVLTLAAGSVLGLLAGGALDTAILGRLGLTLLYILALGFGLWSLCRRAAAFVPGLAPARGVAFALMTAVAVLPFLVLVYASGFESNPLDIAWAPLWVIYPVTRAAGPEAVSSLWIAILIGVAAGVLLYPLHKRAVPAAPRAPKPLPVFGAAGAE